MTVEELIEELKKYPKHYSVAVNAYEDIYFVDDVKLETNMDAIGPVVKIEIKA